MSLLPKITGDIEFDLAHSAPVVLRSRRGNGHEIVRAPMATPVRIRRVPRKSFKVVAVNLKNTHSQEYDDLNAFEGKFWRKGTSGGGLTHAVNLLRNPDPMAQGRGGYEDLWLDPAKLFPDTGSFIEFYPKMPEGSSDRIALDFSAQVASGMARRFSERVLHDGKDLWLAIDPPLMLASGRALDERKDLVASQNRTYERPRFMANRPVSLRLGHESVEHLIRWRALNQGDRKRRKPEGITDDQLRDIARRLGESLNGIGDPNADLIRYVRTIATGLLPVADTILSYKTRDRPKLAGAPADEIRSRVRDLLPHAMLAMVDMVPEEDHALVIDKAEGLLRELGKNLPHTGSYAISYVRAHLSFITHVVRPRIGGHIPEADEEILSSLAAR